MTTIVVTGTRYGNLSLAPFGFDMDFFSAGFGAFYAAYGSTTLGTTAGSGRHRFEVPEQGNRPKTVMENLDADEAARVLQALDNAPRDSDLAETFEEMADRDVTLNVRIITEAEIPSWFQSPESQEGGTRIPVSGSANGPLAQGGTVEILIVGSRLGAAGTANDFTHVLGHELTHLIRGPDGFFLDEFEVQGRDGTTTQRLFSYDSTSDILQSIDVVPQWGFVENGVSYWQHQGTPGNNLFRDSNGQWDYVVTGGGNDIIISAEGSDKIVVTGGGVKIISDYGYGYDWLVMQTVQNVSDLVVTEIGYDLFLTREDSVYAPASDPNAVILVDWYIFFGNDHIEFLQTNSGEVIGIMTLAGISSPYNYYSTSASATDTGSLATAPVDSTLWTMPQTSSTRYEGVTHYYSTSVPDGLAFNMSPTAFEHFWEATMNLAVGQGLRPGLDHLDGNVHIV